MLQPRPEFLSALTHAAQCVTAPTEIYPLQSMIQTNVSFRSDFQPSSHATEHTAAFPEPRELRPLLSCLVLGLLQSLFGTEGGTRTIDSIQWMRWRHITCDVFLLPGKDQKHLKSSPIDPEAQYYSIFYPLALQSTLGLIPGTK